MDFLNIFLDVVKNKYADFNGRARRKEYWGYTLIVVIISIVLNIVFGLLANVASFFAYIPYLVSLALLVPGIAVAARRLHDIGKSGYFLFISLIPLVGGLYLLYLMVQDSTVGSNEYGEDPKKGEVGHI